MRIDLTIRNYRCFSDAKPVHLKLRDGFTAFVGPNNAGKSSLVRLLFEFRQVFQGLIDLNQIVNSIRRGKTAFNLPVGVRDLEALRHDQNTRDLEILCHIDRAEFPRNLGARRLVDVAIRLRREEGNYSVALTDSGSELSSSYRNVEGSVIHMEDNSIVEMAPYIAAFRVLADTQYVGAFRNAINQGSNQAYYDLQTGDAFIRLWKDWQSGDRISFNRAINDLLEEIRRIYGFMGLQVIPSADNQTLQLTIDGRPFKLADVGSGLAQFLVVLGNVATRRPAFLLIDEPELHLHPSLQLDFLTALGSYTTCGVLFSTHSIGLARSSAETIYAVQRPCPGAPSEVRLYEEVSQLAEFLGEMSFSGYRELGFRRVLLVEGVNDVLAVQQFLRLFRKEHEIVPLPLGGSSMINGGRKVELAEILRISPDISALIDSERDNESSALPLDRQAFADVCDELGIQCQVLRRRAIENYFTEEAVRRVKGDRYRALGHFELLRSAPLSWSKTDNWRIAREMTLGDLEGTDLGNFLASL